MDNLNKTTPILDIKDLEIVYKTDLEEVFAVNSISLTLNKGETIGIVGETGAGKTTTALSILKLLPERIGKIKKGSIVFEGRDVLSLDESEMRKIRGDKIAMIFQDPMTALNPVYTVGEQIGEAIQLHHKDWEKKEVDTRVDEVLKLVGIVPERKDDYPHQFSGGMKQRVVIAMALSCEPDLLIADEPTTALDVTIQAQVLKLMKGLRDSFDMSMIMITHDLGIVAQTCDKVAIMYAGEIIESGTLEDVFTGKRHHPYTIGLFGSIPNMKVESDRLHPIPGLMPDPTNLPKGCSFSTRCPHCTEICRESNPPVIANGSHMIKCHMTNEATKECHV